MSKTKGKDLPKVFGIIYAPPKKGKTLGLIKSFPNALVVTSVGGTSCCDYIGHEPDTWELSPGVTVDKITDVVHRASKKYDAIIIDDFSLIADAELIHIQSNPRNAGFKAFDVLIKTMYKLRDGVRDVWHRYLDLLLGGGAGWPVVHDESVGHTGLVTGEPLQLGRVSVLRPGLEVRYVAPVPLPGTVSHGASPGSVSL